ncbi:MAG: Hsp20/alpha crystallin family protein [Treponema sp.]|nr:Hsp20/alpha crystallin family protein [Treponema sp.]MBQ6567903.1 Hsp20/alpha crystallin family protein [Treponema sp.]
MNELSLFNNFFDDVLPAMPDFTFTRTNSLPKVDVKETKDSYDMYMDLPGMDENDVNVELDHNVLKISSVRTENKEDKGDKNEKESKYLIRERRMTSFSRSFTLPEDVDGSKISATFKNGILALTMPRTSAPAPKKIAITAA